MKNYQEYQKISELLLESEIFRNFIEHETVLDDVNRQIKDKINFEDYLLLRKIYNFTEKKITFDTYSFEVDSKINNTILSIIENNEYSVWFHQFLTLENIMLYKKHLLLIANDIDFTETSSRFFRKTSLK